MKFENYGQKWCPFGRISIQHTNGNAGITVVPAGAFNTILLSEGGKDSRFMPTTCIGSQCPMYRKSMLPWRWGRCLFAHEPLKGTLWTLFLLSAGLLAGFAFFLLSFVQKGA